MQLSSRLNEGARLAQTAIAAAILLLIAVVAAAVESSYCRLSAGLHSLSLSHIIVHNAMIADSSQQDCSLINRALLVSLHL